MRGCAMIGTYHKVNIISIDDVRSQEVIPPIPGTRDIRC
jgi:hypothetical protein